VDGQVKDGVLWTWTVQRFPPKSPPYVVPPDGFVPFAVGYVELVDGSRIEAILDVETPHIGMKLQLSHEDGRVPHAKEVG
jgi:uncharacterized OB-fold protein